MFLLDKPLILLKNTLLSKPHKKQDSFSDLILIFNTFLLDPCLYSVLFQAHYRVKE
jgi:hypothetical protein